MSCVECVCEPAEAGNSKLYAEAEDSDDEREVIVVDEPLVVESQSDVEDPVDHNITAHLCGNCYPLTHPRHIVNYKYFFKNVVAYMYSIDRDIAQRPLLPLSVIQNLYKYTYSSSIFPDRFHIHSTHFQRLTI